MVPKRIIWHHSGADAPTPQFEAINEWHKEKDFPLSSLGYYVGYHWVIEKDGILRSARVGNEVGYHDAGENADSIGVCLVGNFSKTTPTKAQEAAFRQLLRVLVLTYDISINAIEPHRRDDKTECPGKNLPDNWPLGLL